MKYAYAMMPSTRNQEWPRWFCPPEVQHKDNPNALYAYNKLYRRPTKYEIAQAIWEVTSYKAPAYCVRQL